VATFKHEPDGEVSGVYAGTGETWRVKFDKRGLADVKDEAIAAQLNELADLKGHPIKAVKD